MISRSQHPSRWLDIAHGELHVPPPGRDGQSYEAVTARLVRGEEDAQTFLRYRRRPDGGDVTPTGHILDAFIRLAEVPEERFAERVATFANTFGVLGICRHGKPARHGPCLPLQDHEVIFDETKADETGVVTIESWLYIEPLEAWRRYTRQLRAILGVIARLQSDMPGLSDDWATIVAANSPEETADVSDPQEHVLQLPNFRPPSSKFRNAVERVQLEREEIGLALDTWIRYGGITLGVEWSDAPYAEPRLRVDRLAAALAAGLVSAAQGPVYVCSGCGNPFALGEGKKRLPAGKNKWCNQCGRPAMLRAAQQRHYQRSKKSMGVGTDSQIDSQA
jgi:hypothetical protein